MATAAQVTSLYQELLGRAPDAGGLQYYQGYSDPNAIRSSILGSTEYKSKGSAPASTGPNSQALFDFAAQQKTDSNALLDRQKSEQQGLFDQYTQKLGSQEQLPVLYQRLQNEAGIPELSQQSQAFKDEIYRVKGLLDHLNDDVVSRTQGTLTTDSMRNRIVASEGDPLRTNLARLGTGLEPIADMLTSAQQQVGNLMPLYMQQQSKELQPLEMQINSLSDRFARELTGFNSDKETQLNALMDQITRGRQLADRDWELAQQLAAEEREFSRQKQLAATSVASYLPSTQGSQPATNSSSTIRQLPAINNSIVPLAMGQTNAAGVPLLGGNSLNPAQSLMKQLTGK